MRRRRMGRPGLIGTAARTAVVAGTATAVSGSLSRRQYAKAQQQAAEQQPVAPAQPAPAHDDKIEKLKQLGELKNAGILTDEEFAAEKAKILNS